MNAIDEYYEIQIDKQRMQATLIQKVRIDEETNITVDELKLFIKEHGIVFGVKEEQLEKAMLADSNNHPLIIAEGVNPVNGTDARLNPIFPTLKEVKNRDDLRKVDLKQVISIPSVTHGQLIGEKIPATSGVSGTNIFGEEIVAKPGKDFRFRPGKNTRIEENSLYATIDGQMSVEPKIIHVYPLFEVNGDLDLKTGNIDFVGSVNIRGNVPAGFEIRSKGDIRIHGTVESATLISEGAIFVSAGIVGQGKGLIRATGDLHTSFINQGIVEVEGDVNVTQSILHSKIQAGGNVYCHKGKGNIVGGDISAGKNIFVKEVGNAHNTKTTLYLGVHQEMLNKEKLYSHNYKKAEEDLKKLHLLLTNLSEKEKLSPLSPSEKIMKLRVRNTITLTTETMLEAKGKLEDFKEVYSDNGHSEIMIEKQVFANVDVYFGKYRRKIISHHQQVKVYLENSEITIGPI
ncbi:DUF342 domain-containing protein [Anaerobacillus alkaliphilus]|uniref:DUF342 domain-containing protein n=1 Tax=Anaerobacillus alkaliphilus TaxID=1548597 RepID=A0A4Q0VNS0_9BACI|nr:FapA family protein [Anaerobacillus alkaliphilus]RXI97983.1 DUF342 domain-containing protein [Anaerobacillus alkaliphilus]